MARQQPSTNIKKYKLYFLRKKSLLSGKQKACRTLLAARYLRTAFPDSFEEGFRSVKDSFSKLIVEHDNLVYSILIHLDSLKEQQQYEIDLRLMVAPTTLAVTNNADTLKQLADDLQKALKTSSVFFEKDCIEPRCSVMSMTEMTLWQHKGFLDFSRFDYLSFGEGNQVN